MIQALLALALLAAPPDPVGPRCPLERNGAPVALSAEDYLVLRAALDEIGRGSKGEIVLDSPTRDDATPSANDFVPAAEIATRLERDLPGLPPGLATAFAELRFDAIAIDPAAAGDGVRVVSYAEIRALFDAGPGEGWDAFYAKYPEASALVRVTRPAFDASGTYAMVGASVGRTRLHGTGILLVLQKEEGVWLVRRAAATWVTQDQSSAIPAARWMLCQSRSSSLAGDARNASMSGL